MSRKKKLRNSWSHSSHAALKVLSGELRPGRIAFLPRDGEAYLGLSKHPPEEVKNHPVLVVEVFDRGRGREHESCAWVPQISGTLSSHSDTENMRHIMFKRHRNIGEEEAKHTEKCSRESGCRLFMLLQPFGRMQKLSYVNATRVYEVPLNCLQRTTHEQKEVQICSMYLAATAAAEAIADLLLHTQIYGIRDRIPALLRPISTREEVPEGRFCWVQPDNGHFLDNKGFGLRNTGGPCVVLYKNSETAIVCMVSDCRTAETRGIESDDLKNIPTKFRLRIGAQPAWILGETFAENTKVDVQFEDRHRSARIGYVPEQYLIAYPGWSDMTDFSACLTATQRAATDCKIFICNVSG